ncbi:MAG: tetratricopeptide repeat protein [Verrucomicrobia bacterium]|nr:tetratricopeptide repeat protein [Verrucomicrobiota bacterium]
MQIGHRSSFRKFRRACTRFVFSPFAVVAAWTIFQFTVNAADLEEGRKLLRAGNYAECAKIATEALADRRRSEEWTLLYLRALTAEGHYEQARDVADAALQNFPISIRLRLLARDAFYNAGNVDRAKEMLNEINELGGTRISAYRDPPNLVALGRAAILLGADPRGVLEQFFDRAKAADPELRDVYLASGELALDKHDADLAAKSFQAGLKRFADDADLHFGLARAYASSDRVQMIKSLNAALEHNPRHVASLLFLVDHMIDTEDYSTAEETLGKIFKVNAWEPQGWAYRTAIAHLRNDQAGAADARAKALKFWDTNPLVEHTIGRKLSQKYRFTEGSQCQRRALEFDKDFLPAKNQLAQDLLRLGEEEEGWRLADEVYKQDAYDVSAFNLVTLHESLAKFHTVTNESFLLRMSAREVEIYGGRALALLLRAKTNLCQKYGIELTKPTTVEIFPEQRDFGVRTFGMPENPGFLGVCFGTVITANSPASQAAHPANWEAVLWHEFCHVVTLQLTRNRMPRWLSEGISVYEERQLNPAWGQRMTPRYRERVTEGKLTPVGKLSAAFLTAKGDEDLQFAYYESSLVVEFVVQNFGLEKLKGILRSLRDGIEINAAIASNTVPMEKIEKDFVAFAQARAKELGPGLDWEKPSADEVKVNLMVGFPAKYSKNYWMLNEYAQKLMKEKKWSEAKTPLEKLIELYPDQTEAGNAYALLAETHRALGETNLERQVLTKLAAQSADSVDAYQRLIELAVAAGDSAAAAENANRFLAVNPMTALPHRSLAQASEALGRPADALAGYRAVLAFDPPDPADIHFRLAKLLRQSGDAEARRQVLLALEEAPRFRDAHRLLQEINRGHPRPTEGAPTALPPVK